MSEDTTAIVAAILAAATEPKHFAGSVDAPPEQGKDALGWAGRQD